MHDAKSVIAANWWYRRFGVRGVKAYTVGYLGMFGVWLAVLAFYATSVLTAVSAPTGFSLLFYGLLIAGAAILVRTFLRDWKLIRLINGDAR